MSEKFSEADIYGTYDNDVIVDDGHFIHAEKGFQSLQGLILTFFPKSETPPKTCWICRSVGG